MAANARNPPQPSSNGVITAPPKGLTGGNRKKQKRRAKQHARAVSNDSPLPAAAAAASGRPADLDYDEDPLRYADEEYEEDYSDAEPQQYHDAYIPPHDQNGYAMPPPAKNRKKNKKKRTSHHDVYNPELLGSSMPPLPTPPPPSTSTSAAALRTMHKSVANHPNIWNTSTQQERQNIKDFWLSLSEDARKSLLKIEKEAVLRKMKQQQKHSCSCTVCGRKRTAIEEELEVLYEGYYEELEQYAHHDHPPLSTDGMLPEPLQHRRPPHPLAAPPPNPHHRSSQMLEHLDEEEEISEDEEEYSDEEDEEDEDEEDEEDDEEYSDEEPEPPRGPVPDFFNFGQNLTVKGIPTPWLELLRTGLKGKTDNLLTVADDLLKNDGRKFIEMMEQLAERRMQRESEAEYAAANPSHPGAYPPNDPAYNHEDPLAPGDEYDDEEASYDSQEEYDDDLEEEDEMVGGNAGKPGPSPNFTDYMQGGLTEEQRMQEGRRMFQIFAARMFEQRVLTAYKEKVAAERQQKLLEELQDEEKQSAQREAKKKRDAEKKKEKKRQQQLAKAEEKERKDALKATADAEARLKEEEKQKELRLKKEEQRKKKEEERRKQEEERVRKEAEKHRRQADEQQRREEAERKAREQRAADKAKKEEARKREREEREARELEAKERKAQEEKDRKEREAKSKADREARERDRNARAAAPHSQPPNIVKRPSQAGMVAVPGVHPKQTASGISSPHPAVATPVVPKAPTPARHKQSSQQGSHTSSPRQPQSQPSSAPSKSSSPGSVGPQQPMQNGAKSFMQKGMQQQGPHPHHQMNSPLHHQSMQPPPGMQHAQHLQSGFGGMPPLGFQAFQGPGPMMHNMGQRGPMPMYGHQGPPMGVPNRMSPFGPPGMNGMPGPPGMMHPQGRGMGFPFDQPGVGAPPGFGPQMPPQQPNQASPLGPPLSNGTPGTDITKPSVPVHSRQHSSDNSGASQPIARPAPIQRPGSIRSPGDGSISPRADVDDLSKHLGSSALLDDSDEPIPQGENRRMSHNIPPPSTRSQSLGIGGLMQPPGGFGTPATSWATPSLPFGQSPGLGQQQWGSLPNASPMTGWTNNNAFATNGAFGPMGVGAQMPMQMHRTSGFGGQQSRPLALRLAICQACKQLGATDQSSDGFHDIHTLMRQMPALDPPPSLKEVEEICETEGDSQNGGGELSARKSGGDVVAVKWAPDSGTPKDQQGRGSHAGLGEIGSPMPSRRSPAGIGFGAPGRTGGFASLGAVGSPSF
ncbi:hypothetical protein Q7P37_010089 [Cladosporium fusiforme]